MPDAFEWREEALTGELAGYQVLTTLKRRTGGVTCIVRDRETGQRGVLKTASGESDIAQLKNEEELLRRIGRQTEREAESFPRVIYSGQVEIDGQPEYALIRTYIPGRSLEEIVESGRERPGMPRAAALSALIGVLEQLRFLHSLPRPVIHRDIKPQNVIMDDCGACHLIDLGISRERRDGDQPDTRVMGTAITAPPEQFGYRQTDERSDIYSAGVLLRYCLTGEYEDAQDPYPDGDVARIIEKATMFDPKARYQTAKEMLCDLLTARYGPEALDRRPPRRARRGRLWGLAALLCVVALIGAAVFIFGRAPRDTDVYTFKEPLIEQAARQALGIPGRPLTYGDLKDVTSINIFGRQVCQASDIWFQGDTIWIYNDAMREDGLWEENGGIASLDDVKAMPNLRELGLYKQAVTDIRALKGTRIARLGLGFNPLDDLSPLAGNGHIIWLNVSGLRIAGARQIAALPSLEYLDIGATDITSIAALEGLPLTGINLCNVYLTDESELGRLKRLKTLTIKTLTRDAVKALSALPIEELICLGADDVPLQELSVLSSLTQLIYGTAHEQTMGEDPIDLPHLALLRIGSGMTKIVLPSLRCLSGLTELENLSIMGCEVLDYSGLEGLSRLTHIDCTPAQFDALNARYPGKEWGCFVDEPG